jgi:hypothetical protein
MFTSFFTKKVVSPKFEGHHSLYIIDFFAVPTITPVVIGCGLGFDRHQDFLRSCSQAGTRTPTVVDSETHRASCHDCRRGG